MLTTIDFHNKPRLKTNKIKNEVPKRMLSAEFHAPHLFLPEALPKPALRLRHVLSQCALEFPAGNELIRLAFHGPNPIPALTLPLKGRVLLKNPALKGGDSPASKLLGGILHSRALTRPKGRGLRRTSRLKVFQPSDGFRSSRHQIFLSYSCRPSLQTLTPQ